MDPGKKEKRPANLDDVYTKSKRRQYYRTARTLLIGFTVPLLIGVAISIVIYRHSIF